MKGSNSRVQRIALCVLVVLFVTICSAHATETNQPYKVIVQKGDMLSSIIMRETGSSDPNVWKLVADFNNRTVNQTLEIGDVVLLPAELMEPQAGIVVLEEQVVTQSTEPGAAPLVEMKEEFVEPGDVPDLPSTQEAQNNACAGQQVCFNEEVTVEDSKSPLEVPNNVSDSDSAKPVQTTVLPTPDKSAEVESQASVDAIEETSPPSLETNGSVDTVIQQADVDSKESVDEVLRNVEPSKEQSTNLPDESQVKQMPASPPVARSGLFEVDEDAAIRALERSLIQLNALLLAPRRAELTFSFGYSFDENLEPVLVSVEDAITGETAQQVGQLRRQISDKSAVLDLKFGLPYDSQVNLSLPFSSITQDVGVIVPGSRADNQQSTTDGIGDFAITVDKTLAVENGRRPDIILSATYNSDSGSDEAGSDANEFSVGITATKRQDPLVFTGSMSQTFAQESNSGVKAGNVTQVSLGALLAASPYTSLRFLFSQAFLDNTEIGGESLSGSDATVASFVTGVSSVLSKDVFLSAQLDFGLVEKASDYRISISIARQFSY